jgi:AcrR family transcriptional regulator
VEATFRVVAATGDAIPSIRPILDEAGLSRQAFYRCFESKDELMSAVLAEGSRLLVDYVAARMAKAATPEAKVRAWIGAMMRQAEAPHAAERTRPFIASLREGGIPNSVAHAGSERQRCQLLEDALTAGVAEGAWDATDPPTDALRIHDFVMGSLRRHLLSRQVPTRATTQALGDFVLRGIGATTSAPIGS